MPIGKVTTRFKNPKFNINLVTLYDKAILPTELGNRLRSVVSNPVFHQFIGQRIVDRIVERTESGIDMKGKAFRGYSKAYRDSLVFQIFKGGDTSVNMRLTGDMLENVISETKGTNSIVVFLADETEQLKAGGHMSGSKRGPGVKREFLGLPDGELVKIMKQSVKDFRQSSPAAFAELFV